MRHGCAGWVGLTVLATGWTGAQASEWQDQVAALATERTRAMTCAQQVIDAGEPAALAQGKWLYGQAKAEFDGVIAGLLVVLSESGKPDRLSDLNAHLHSGFEQRQALCRLAQSLEVPALRGGHKSMVTDILDAVIGPLVEAVKALYHDYREAERLRRETIANSLEATRWPAFSDLKQP